MHISKNTVRDNALVSNAVTTNNAGSYFDQREAVWNIFMPFLGTEVINIQTSFTDDVLVQCPFYKIGMPIGASISYGTVAVNKIPKFGSVECDGAFTLSIDISGSPVYPVLLTLTVG
jgi:hypothetical protein